ncbi:MAG: hypothetical protein ACTS77_03430, partial [Arsenophonus sp. NC-TX2-MAG3]
MGNEMDMLEWAKTQRRDRKKNDANNRSYRNNGLKHDRWNKNNKSKKRTQTMSSYFQLRCQVVQKKAETTT